MSEKELEEIKKAMRKRQAAVAKSPKAATEFLIELGVMNKNGMFKKRFKVT
jgi:hypothetical protein